jgi:hypothetical protein
MGATGAEAAIATWLGPDALLPLAWIWATLELERALGDLGADPALAGAAVDEPLLGARVVVLPATDDGPDIALAEPSTEGRLAASLARHGEGRAGAYWRVPAGLDVALARAVAAGVSVSQPANGPFGRSVLVEGQRFARSHAILVDAAAVPSPP